MKNTLFISWWIGILLVLTSNVYAGEKTLLDYIETGLSITSDVLQGANALDEMANRNRQKTVKKVEEKIVYKDRIIYKDNEQLSEENRRIKKELANAKRYLAWEKAKDGDHEKAVELYQESLEYDANNWRMWHGYGWSFSEIHRYKEAENAFMVAIEQGAKDETWRYLGWNYARQGHHKEAIRCYTESLYINPDNEQALHGLKWSQQQL